MVKHVSLLSNIQKTIGSSFQYKAEGNIYFIQEKYNCNKVICMEFVAHEYIADLASRNYQQLKHHRAPRLDSFQNFNPQTVSLGFGEAISITGHLYGSLSLHHLNKALQSFLFVATELSLMKSEFYFTILCAFKENLWDWQSLPRTCSHLKHASAH